MIWLTLLALLDAFLLVAALATGALLAFVGAVGLREAIEGRPQSSPSSRK